MVNLRLGWCLVFTVWCWFLFSTLSVLSVSMCQSIHFSYNLLVVSHPARALCLSAKMTLLDSHRTHHSRCGYCVPNTNFVAEASRCNAYMLHDVMQLPINCGVCMTECTNAYRLKRGHTYCESCPCDQVYDAMSTGGSLDGCHLTCTRRILSCLSHCCCCSCASANCHLCSFCLPRHHAGRTLLLPKSQSQVYYLLVPCTTTSSSKPRESAVSV